MWVTLLLYLCFTYFQVDLNQKSFLFLGFLFLGFRFSLYQVVSQTFPHVPVLFLHLYRLLKNGYLVDLGRRKEKSAKETDFKSM